MNTEHELKVAIERIVRPIYGMATQKLRMREELYAHALDAFDHEVSRGAGQAEAVQRTIERLGDPIVTRAELQATIPWSSRWIDWLLGRRNATSILAHANRIALGGAVIFAVWVSAIIAPLRWDELIAWSPKGRMIVWSLGATNVWLFGVMFLGTLFAHAGWRLADRRYGRRGDYARATGLVLLAAGIIVGMRGCLTYILSLDSAASLETLQAWMPVALPLGLSSLILPHFELREQEPLAEWLELEIAE